MRKWQIGLALLLLALVLPVLAACNRKAVARVNGLPIYQSQIDEQINLFKQQQPGSLQGPGGQEQEKRLRAQILDVLINQQIILQQAKKQHITASAKEINDQLDQIKRVFPDEKKFAEALAQRGLTVEQLRDKIDERLLVNKIQEQVTQGLAVAESDIRDYYEKNKSVFKEPDRWKLRHILVKTKVAAEKVAAELAKGADFAAKAKAVSVDKQTNTQGGELQWQGQPQMLPETYNAVKDLGAGQRSGVVSASDGFHIYQVDDRKPARQRGFEEVKDQIRQQLLAQKQRVKFQGWLDNQRKKAKIVKTS